MQPRDSAPPDTVPSDQNTASPVSGVDTPSDADWQYSTEVADSSQELEPVTWSASEYIDHEKTSTWYVAVAVIAIILTGLVYILTRDIVNCIAIVIFAGFFAVVGARKPRTLEYALSLYGIQVGSKNFSYSEFKSFAVMHEGAINSIHLLPLKRFATGMSLYFPPDQEENIVDILGSFIPQEIRKHDPIDRLMNKVRF